MNKFYNALHNYLVYASPFVLAEVIWCYFQTSGSAPPDATLAIKGLWEILSWNLMLWFTGLAIFFCLIAFSTTVRKKALFKIAALKDSDEREEYITGKASSSSYISTLGVLIFLLFLSIVHVEINRLSPGQSIEGHTKEVKIGAGINIFETEKDKNPEKIVAFNDIPLTKTGLIMLILVWQLASFNWNARKEIKKDQS